MSIRRIRRPLLVAALHPLVTIPGYWVATAGALAWSALLGARTRRAGRLVVAEGLPGWAFGRGGTTIGRVFLTSTRPSESVLEHEAVHERQWRRFGIAMIPLYLAAGLDPTRNRFEIEADLVKGGYASAPPVTTSTGGAAAT